ncbi:hypothetical protein [Hymenobacter sp. HDW8]|nr:hypothetical protein [Hymenobacter sp. HDW8]
MRKLFNYFLNGFLIVAPVGLTIYILFATIRWLDSLFRMDNVPPAWAC